MKRTTPWLLFSLVASLVFLTAAAGATVPVASFTSNITGGSVPLSVQFIDTSSNSPTSWAWSFGDGGTSAAQSPAHQYSGSGTFTVTLTATNSDGSNTNTESAYITVDEVGEKPGVAFVSNVTSGSKPLSVQFIDTSSNSPTSWAWSFGDGGTSSSQNPSHAYTTTGTYTVTLTSTNSAGSATISKDSYISVAAASTAPVASFAATKTSGSTPLSVQFIDTSSNSPTTWAWSFGDGYTSVVQNPVHIYAGVGTYTVTLTATNSAGSSTKTRSDYIETELAAPIASFTANATTGTEPFYVQFNDTSENTPTYWHWYFGDSGTSSGANPLHEYTDAGSYTVVLTVSNAEGSNSTSKAKFINVSRSLSPVTSFTADARNGIVPLTVRFTDTSANSPTSWKWNFGDGSTSTEQNPSNTYTRAGTFSVSLTATNDLGSRTVTSDDYIVVTVGAVDTATTLPTPEPVTLVTTASDQAPVATTTAAAGTGDSSGLLPWVLVVLVAVGGISIFYILKRRPPQGPHHSHNREL
jgi:PKD repeat protein